MNGEVRGRRGVLAGEMEEGEMFVSPSVPGAVLVRLVRDGKPSRPRYCGGSTQSEAVCVCSLGDSGTLPGEVFLIDSYEPVRRVVIPETVGVYYVEHNTAEQIEESEKRVREDY